MTRAFCNINHGFQNTPSQAHKTDILEVRPRRFSNFFLTTRTITQKSSRQSLSSIVVSILERQVLQMHTTLKSLWQNLPAIYLCVRVRYDCTDSCSADLFHRLLKDTALC